MEDLVYRAAYGRRREVLLALYNGGPMTLNKLRAKLGASSSALLFDIAALEALGLIKREDGVIELTDRGAQLASIISSVAPLKSLSLFEALGLRPIVVYMLSSPYLRFIAVLLAILWAISLYPSGVALVGVIYTGMFPRAISIPISLTSFALLISLIWLFNKRKANISHIIIGLFPLLLYPSLALLPLGNVALFALKFILLLFTCATLSTVASYDLGVKYEWALLIYLSAMFVFPILGYLMLHGFMYVYL
nr:MAG: ArsR family transcriptional regulator [Thermoproteus sp. AZ2]